MTKITGTNTYIDVEIDERMIRIYGELVVGGFVCYEKSIREWMIPFEEQVTEAEKQMIIQKSLKKARNQIWKLHSNKKSGEIDKMFLEDDGGAIQYIIPFSKSDFLK